MPPITVPYLKNALAKFFNQRISVSPKLGNYKRWVKPGPPTAMVRHSGRPACSPDVGFRGGLRKASRNRGQRREEKQNLKVKKSTFWLGAAVSLKGLLCYHGCILSNVHSCGDRDGKARAESPQLAAEESSADSKKEQSHQASGLPTASPRLWESRPRLYLGL